MRSGVRRTCTQCTRHSAYRTLATGLYNLRANQRLRKQLQCSGTLVSRKTTYCIGNRNRFKDEAVKKTQLNEDSLLKEPLELAQSKKGSMNDQFS